MVETALSALVVLTSRPAVSYPHLVARPGPERKGTEVDAILPAVSYVVVEVMVPLPSTCETLCNLPNPSYVHFDGSFLSPLVA